MESVPWKHSVPTSMSWYQGQNPFNYYHHSFTEEPRKRKAPFIDDSPLPSKQYVSEDAMAAHLNQLHIGNQLCLTGVENRYDQSGSQIGCLVNDVNNDIGDYKIDKLNARFGDELDNPKLPGDPDRYKSQLYISPEVATIQPEPILPKSIMDQIKRPSMELVLWKPPVGLVDSLIRSALAKDDLPKDNNANKKTVEEINESMEAEMASFCDNSTMHKPFHLVRVVPAMTEREISSFEEEMNII